MERVLVLSPHPDDAEFGCGATMAMLATKGCDVWHALLSLSEKTAFFKSPGDCLDEFTTACEVLDVIPVRTDFMEHRELQRDRQKLLDNLIRLRNTLNPDTVFMPCLDDTHQDHAAVLR